MAVRRKIISIKKVYQLKITLKNIKPPIWRRIEVTDDTPLDKLHNIIQTVMGWDNAHLHQFIIDKRYYGETKLKFDSDMEDERILKLSQIATKEKSKFIYEYDLGDCWEHEVLVEKILSLKSGKKYPLCTKGKRACPPEDVGGVWGYADFLEIIKDKKHPEHEETMEWAGDDFDSEAFDLDKVNKRLMHIK